VRAACASRSGPSPREGCVRPRQPQVKPAGRLDVAQQCLVARQRVAVLRSGNPAARPADIRKRLPEKRKSSRVADDGEVSPSLIIINGVACEGSASTTGGDSADDACEIDLDERSLAFRRPRAAAGTMAPRGGPAAAGICPGADTGSGQRLRMGWPVFQRWRRILYNGQVHGNLFSGKVGTRTRHRRLPRRPGRHEMILGTRQPAGRAGRPVRHSPKSDPSAAARKAKAEGG
jgi:hypothetical protein